MLRILIAFVFVASVATPARALTLLEYLQGLGERCGADVATLPRCYDWLFSGGGGGGLPGGEITTTNPGGGFPITIEIHEHPGPKGEDDIGPPPPTPVRVTVNFSEVPETYDVYGTTIADISAGLNGAPGGHAGFVYMNPTSVQIVPPSLAKGGYQSGPITVDVTLTEYLPQWKSKLVTSSECVKASWATFEERLRAHEQHHIDAWHALEAEIRSRVKLVYKNADQAGSAATKAIRDAISAIKKSELAWDKPIPLDNCPVN